ncbi:hypothetical protein [Bacillus paranthracis]|uniref:hypothetical protein n=1 Tax=Bacillus paranthracis TaxID=2026186 RepID=UPI0022E2B875|nr:hypothetical protein [Bacillus paranthracis]
MIDTRGDEMERSSIKLKRIEVSDFIETLKQNCGGKIKYRKGLMLVNIRGCNGSGKSTVPLSMLAEDRGAFIFTIDGKDRATVFPSFGFVAMGRYRTKTGGLDGFKGNEETMQTLEALWETPFSILMEGVISSTIYSTYLNLFKELEERQNPNRKILIYNLLPPFEVCLERIKGRSPDTFHKIKVEQIEGKWRTVSRNAKKFADEGLDSIVVDNSSIKKQDTLKQFLNYVKEFSK